MYSDMALDQTVPVYMLMSQCNGTNFAKSRMNYDLFMRLSNTTTFMFRC